MNRKIVSLILIPFVLLTQSVIFGHSHAGNQPAGHELHAHIHVGSSAVDEQHGHVHSHGTHSHAHPKQTDSEQDKPACPQVEFPFDHDSSALYLNSTDLISGSRSILKIDLLPYFQGNMLGADAPDCPLLDSTLAWSRLDCAPPDPGSPLFLRHHAYLI